MFVTHRYKASNGFPIARAQFLNQRLEFIILQNKAISGSDEVKEHKTLLK